MVKGNKVNVGAGLQGWAVHVSRKVAGKKNKK